MPHEEGTTVCPTTGLSIERGASSRPPDPRPDAEPSPPADAPAGAVRPSFASDPSTIVGKVVDGMYYVKGVVGRGGMATVYDAEQIAMERPVALKVLTLDRRGSEEAHKRLLREARAAAAILHPNVCQVYDFGTLPDGSPYIAMERLYGEPLSARLEREGALSFVDAIDVVMQILAGLSAAHKRGIVHRDVKPDNVFLLRREGRTPIVKLLDFGVATSVRAPPASEGGAGEGPEDTTELTRSGIVMGTPFYMAPEQALGERHLDGRVDLFAVGAILYECVTGQRPFAAASHQALLSAILSEHPTPVASLRPEAPPQLDRVLDKAMAKAREDRYANASELIGDLARLRAIVTRIARS